MALYEINAASNYDDPIFGTKESESLLPKKVMPQKENDPSVIRELVKDELFLDGNARQNLATFCQTYVCQDVRDLMNLSINKNLIDKDEYPQTAELERRCVNIVANLWNAPKTGNPVGTSSIGSSEACMLGGMAMLRRWKNARKAKGLSTDKPNLVCGPVQVVWDKFCRYWDVEMRQIPMETDRFYMDGPSMVSQIDENTIGVVATFGLTFTGKYAPVQQLCEALDKLQKEKGLDIQVHVDAASGGFCAPFCQPDLLWDFRLDRVKSISASGHKFGLAPLGAGWVVWRDKSYLPEELIFNVNYLGGNMPVFQINFSRPAGQIISQYYLFTRLGFEGYKKIQTACYETAQFLSNGLDKMGYFDFIYRGDPKEGIPALTWTFKKGVDLGFTLYDLADKLRCRGWLVPAYSLPANAQSVVVQRIIVKQGFGLDMASLLLQDFARAIDELKAHHPVKSLGADHGGFNHN